MQIVKVDKDVAAEAPTIPDAASNPYAINTTRAENRFLNIPPSKPEDKDKDT